ncbi:MAG: hypothetical protein Q7S14_01070 [bacterium]|nr:hypothetical protein [bacterium]
MIIKTISARKILASLGDETVEATINGVFSASVPAGISAGKYEIKKVSADEAIEEIRQIYEICRDKDWTQESLDKEISSHGFGGNSTLAISAAFFKTKKINFIKLPKLMLLLFEGGEHGNKNITMQEFMIIEDSINQASEDFAKLKYYLKQNNIESTVGAEGGFSPLNFNNDKCIETIRNLFPDKKIAIDMADSFGNATVPDKVFSVEDPYNDEDWSSWTKLNNLNKYLVIGDDLTVTNPERIKKAIELKAVGGVVIKPNQIGTIFQAKEAAKLCKENNLKIIVSHRGQETNDYWIADFALDVGADFVKFGGMDRGERIAKYNRLLEIQAATLH